MNLPSLQQLRDDIQADLEAALDITLSTFGKAFLYALTGVQAGRFWLYYKLLAKVQKNVWVDTADSEANGGTLERFGRVKLGRNPFAAVAGSYTVSITGTAGATINSETTFKSADDSLNPGMLYVLDDPYTCTGTADTIVLRSLTPGLEGKLSVGDTLTATAPIFEVNSTATVTVETIQPLAAETTEQYRAKVIDAFRLEAQGGSASDYRLWSYDAQGVKTAYAYTRSGYTSEVNLYVEANVDDSTDGKGTPSTLILDAVTEVIERDPTPALTNEENGRRPVNDIVNVLPITPLTVNINIASFVGRTADIETTIQTALQTEVNKVRPFIAACDVLEEKNDILDTNKVISIILAARPGSVFGAITLNVNGSPVSTYTFTNGNIPWFNALTFS